MIKNKVVEIGSVDWTNNELREAYNDLISIYDQRPFDRNQGGMLLPHLVPCWFYLKKIQPKVIVESGVYRGGGTFFFKRACPNAKIYSIDTKLENLRYKNPDGVYLDKDFTNYNWMGMFRKDGLDVTEDDVLLFFDDHVNAFERSKYVYENTNFKKLMFEDNYPVGKEEAMVYSLKIVLEGKEKPEDEKYLRKILKTYYEFPPLWVDELTRWKDLWTNYPTKEPLFKGLPEAGSIQMEELHDYTWICYVQLI